MTSDALAEPDPLRILLVVAQAARGRELRGRLTSLAKERPVELRVLAPAFARSMLRYLTSDVDEGIRQAQERLERSLGEMSCARMRAVRGVIGEADPLLAIDAALVTFPADEIIIVPSPHRDLCAERELFEHVSARFDLPVREIEIAEDESGAHARETAFAATAAEAAL